MINLYQHRLKKLDDEALLEEVERCGRLMQRGNMTKEEKQRAYWTFMEASSRVSLWDEKEKFLVAIRVLRYF